MLYPGSVQSMELIEQNTQVNFSIVLNFYHVVCKIQVLLLKTKMGKPHFMSTHHLSFIACRMHKFLIQPRFSIRRETRSTHPGEIYAIRKKFKTKM